MKAVLYTTNCPRCKVLESKLSSVRIEFEKATDVDEMIEKGFETAPVLEVDGTAMGFKDAVEWIKKVEKNTT